MEITLNINENSNVELVKDDCQAVQLEKNVTILKLNFPKTIKGYSIDNYSKQIEFGECKELGECKKFLDVVDGDKYELCDICTQFKKVMVQFTLKNTIDEADTIIWKTIPFALEFCESINAENTKEMQATLLSLSEILLEWENYIKANTLRVIRKVDAVPTANAESLHDTIFYLGANSTSPYTLTYGHYYACNEIDGVYEWTDLTQDPSLDGVANGIREINNNQTMQLWVGDKDELANEVHQDGVMYIPVDISPADTLAETLDDLYKQDGKIPVADYQAQLVKPIFSGEFSADGYISFENFDIEDLKVGDILEIDIDMGLNTPLTTKRVVVNSEEMQEVQATLMYDNNTSVIGEDSIIIVSYTIMYSPKVIGIFDGRMSAINANADTRAVTMSQPEEVNGATIVGVRVIK